MTPDSGFQLCTLCERRQALSAGQEGCPAYGRPALNAERLNHLVEQTPFSQWWTPEQLSARYRYVAKHIIRQATHPANRIAVVYVRRRWYILKCSYERFLEEERPRRTTD
ncbi:MAG: hypothetical protein HC915_19310 [Anaerolineae bacterium]|nr:hypothetical protein [Anaerolineae bacterium]